MNREKAKTVRRWRKVTRLRKKLVGKTERPRLAVFRSHKNISCQIVNDWDGKTLISVSSLEPAISSSLKGLKKSDRAAKLGEEIAKRAKEKGISKVLFDRRWYAFHGRVKALAEAARKAGLQF